MQAWIPHAWCEIPCRRGNSSLIGRNGNRTGLAAPADDNPLDLPHYGDIVLHAIDGGSRLTRDELREAEYAEGRRI
jgi:hypothetical protein